ncbi:hypothetical protein MASR2M32_20570 [Sphaerotilus sulfidivorans]
MNDSSIPSRLLRVGAMPALSVLLALAQATAAVPVLAASTAASSALDSASSAVGSLSTSIGQSSRSSSGGDLAAGDWRVTDVAALAPDAAEPGRALLALTLQAEPGGAELVLKLPRVLAERQALDTGVLLNVRRQGWGFELARAGAAEPFFLVLDDMRHRELGSRPVTL